MTIADIGIQTRQMTSAGNRRRLQEILAIYTAEAALDPGTQRQVSVRLTASPADRFVL